MTLTHPLPTRIATTALAAASLLMLQACGSGSNAPDATADTAVSAESKAAASAPAETTFIVTLKPGANSQASATAIAKAQGGRVKFTYSNALKGFAITLPEPAIDAFLRAMDKHADVQMVEEDVQVTANQTAGTVQTGATWGLDRVDQRDLPLSGSYSYTFNGAGVRAYVVDTGILASHTNLGGRVGAGYTAISDGYGSSDCNGHGTHVAGTIGSTTWGVAKGVTLVPVRVLDCAGSGTSSGVIAGLDWVAANGVKPGVVNMSLGGGASSSLDTAVANLVNAGYTVAVAAGNDGLDACTYSPARAPSAITVGATTSTDAKASYSNWGSCVDVFAPGSSITSTWHTSTTATAVLNGTSMATPHVAGYAALILAGTPSATPAQVVDAIKAGATTGKVTSAGTGSPNLLIYALALGVTTPPPPSTVSVSIAGLTGAATLTRKGWSANTTATVRNASGALVSGAVVKGNYSVGGSGLSCTTNTSGTCTIKSGNLSKSTLSTTFSVTDITGTNLSYDASRNTVSSIVIAKP